MQSIMGNKVFLVLLLLVLYSCEYEISSPLEYIKACESSNFLSKKKQIGVQVYELKLLPADYLISREIIEKELSYDSAKDIMDQPKKDVQFIFRFSNIENEDPEKYNLTYGYAEFDNRINKLSFQMDKNFFVLQNEDTFHCNLYHYERTYSLSKSSVFNISIEAFDITKEFTFCYNDEIQNNGLIKLRYSASDINKIPILKL